MEIISVICSHRSRAWKKRKEKRLLNSHKIASAQSEAPAGWEKGMKRGMLLKKTSTASTSHMTLAKFLFVCCSRGRGSGSGGAHSIVLRLLVLFAARGNHNVCIIYLRFAFKGFKLLFNLVFPSWVTPCDDNDNDNVDDKNKNNSNKYANFCAFYWKYCAERKWQAGREGERRGRHGICCKSLCCQFEQYL